MKKSLITAAIALWLQPVQAAEEALIVEDVVSAETPGGHVQRGVLSRLEAAPSPEKLLVVVSGHPGITRPVRSDSGKVTTRQAGNFLVRSRQLLLSAKVATLLLDCRSDFEGTCPDSYQTSAERTRDIDLLVDSVKRRLPSIQQTWMVSTSRGVMTSAAVLKHAKGSYSGVIHTAGTYDLAMGWGLPFGPSPTPQFIFHHRHDPCRVTPYQDAVRIAKKWGITLVSVDGGGGFRGDPCQAFTQHGFAGQEQKVAHAIRFLVESGQAGSTEID